jgi:hypothetical protein
MRNQHIAAALVSTALVAAAAIAGCGGGGSAYSNPIQPPPPTPTPSPSSSPSPIVQLGNMNVATGGTVSGGFTYGPADDYQVIFTCGCSSQAGTTITGATGNFSVTSPASPTPDVPNPTYTMVPSRNYLIEAQPVGSVTGPQAWSIMFAGMVGAHNLALGDSGAIIASSGSSDVYTTAVTLYVYKHSHQCGAQGCNTAFDDWNFNSLQTWLQTTLIGAPTLQEKTLLNDIAAQSALNNSLFPFAPGWDSSQTTNATINHDLNQITAVNDPTVPTPCPGGPADCTGTPTP